MCVKRHSIANNEYITDTFNPNYPTTFLTYSDTKNLYGLAMSSHMQYPEFTWVISPENSNIFNVLNNSETGYILKVDMEYPHLHDLHINLLFLPINEKAQNKITNHIRNKRYI